MDGVETTIDNGFFSTFDEKIAACDPHMSVPYSGSIMDIDCQLKKLHKRGISVNMTGAAAKQQLCAQKGAPPSNSPQRQVTVDLASKRSKKNKNIKRKKKNSTSEVDSESAISNKSAISNESIPCALQNNRFALLSDIHVIDDPAGDAPNISDATGDKWPQTQSLNANDRTKKLQSTENRYCPPIILFDVNVTSLVHQFRTKFPQIEMKIINKSQNKCKMFIKDYDAYTDMMNYLKDAKVSSHSYTPIQLRQVSLILRGLHRGMDASDIKNELDAVLPNVVSSVSKFSTPYMRKNAIDSSLYMVTLLPGKTITEINRIKTLSYQTITWEKPHSFSNEIQCKRCQRWGHTARNCNHPYQCIKCDKLHEPGQCSLNKVEDAQPYCTNCKKWGHPANYRGCDVYKRFLESKNRNININKNLNSNSRYNARESGVLPNRSFASLFHRNEARPVPSNRLFTNRALIEDFMKIAEEIFPPNPITLEHRIERFLKNFKSMTIDDKKLECRAILEALSNADV